MGGELFALALQTAVHVGDFFAEGGWCRRLAVGAAHHRQRGVFVRHGAQFVADGVNLRQEDGVARGFEGEGVREVVDVFAGAGEVDVFADGGDFAVRGKAVFQPVFDGFDVVVGGRFYRFDGGGVLRREVGDDLVNGGEGGGAEGRDFADLWRGGERFQPFEFNADARFHQAVFGEDGAQRGDAFGVTAVKRREGEEGVLHGGSLGMAGFVKGLQGAEGVGNPCGAIDAAELGALEVFADAVVVGGVA